MMTETNWLEELRQMLPPGTTVHAIVRHVSRSGMSRSITLLIDREGDMFILDWLLVKAGLGKLDQKHDGIKVQGCGMDMAFHLVYELGRTLYPNGVPCTGFYRTEVRGNGRHVRGCQSNDHANGDRAYRKGKRHSDGGYALRYGGAL